MTRTELPWTPAADAPAVPLVGVVPHRLRADATTVGVVWRRELARFWHNRAGAVMGLLNPLLFLLVLGTGLGAAFSGEGAASYRAFLFPGVLIMAVQSPAIAVGLSIVWDRKAGFLREMLVAPVRRGALVTGICLGGATAATAHSVLLLAMAGLAGIPYRIGAFALVLLEIAVTALAFTAVGALAAVRIRRVETFQFVVGIALMPMLFLSGAMFPVGGLPGWLHAAVLANPLTYAVDAIRRTLPGAEAGAGPQWWGWTPPVALELALVAGLAVAALTWAARSFATSRD